MQAHINWLRQFFNPFSISSYVFKRDFENKNKRFFDDQKTTFTKQSIIACVTTTNYVWAKDLCECLPNSVYVCSYNVTRVSVNSIYLAVLLKTEALKTYPRAKINKIHVLNSVSSTFFFIGFDYTADRTSKNVNESLLDLNKSQTCSSLKIKCLPE